MRVLILGANGFTARYLIQHLRQNFNDEIYCSSLRPGDSASWLVCDLTVQKDVDSLMAEVRPQQVYQLAASFTNHYETDYLSNVVTSRNVLESIVKTWTNCRVLLVGSSAEYGSVKRGDNPVTEDHPLNPRSVYGLTKAYQTLMMLFYHKVHGCNVVMARPFNLLGPGLSTRLFVGSLYQQIDAYKVGRISKIILGNLRHRRDYIDVKQAVAYYELIMSRGRAGEAYNVGSGTGMVINDLLIKIMSEHGISMDVIEERPYTDANKVDIKDLIASVAKIQSLQNQPQHDSI